MDFFHCFPGDELKLYSLQHLALYQEQWYGKLQLDFGRAKFLKLGIERAEVVGASVDERVLRIMKENISADVIWRAAGPDIDKDIPLAHFCVSFKSENIKT